MTSIGRIEEIQKSVCRIPNKSRIPGRGSREDTGHSSGQETMKNCTERRPTNLKENGNSPRKTWWNTSKKLDTPVFKDISALSRGILISKGGRCTTHFNAHSSNTECLFRTIHSANQLSICGAVSSWCEEFAQRTLHTKKSGRWKSSWQKNMSSFWKCDAARSGFFGANSMEGQWGIWNQIARTTSEMETLEKEVQFTKVCEDASFWRRVSIGMSYKTVPDVDDGFGDRTSACREYTLFREDPNSRINATIRGQTSIERVLRVRCVLPLLKVISWFVARFLTHFFPHNSLLQVDYSFRCSFFRRVQPCFSARRVALWPNKALSIAKLVPTHSVYLVLRHIQAWRGPCGTQMCSQTQGNQSEVLFHSQMSKGWRNREMESVQLSPMEKERNLSERRRLHEFLRKGSWSNFPRILCSSENSIWRTGWIR